MYRIDLNCDVGEGFGIYSFGHDEEIIKLITSANIACGFHAGDPNQMFKTVNECLKNGVAIGAHPGYPDLIGFGRRPMCLSYNDVRHMIVYQVGALMAVARSLGGEVKYVKPHGELYNSAVSHIETASAVIDAVASLEGPALVTLAGSPIVELAREKGLKVLQEGYADRNYKADGTLLGRKSGGAVVTDPVEAAGKAVKMVKENRVVCCDGKEIKVYVDTICVHGDNANAVAILQEIRAAFLKDNVLIKNPFEEL